jgi:hypothetical protein
MSMDCSWNIFYLVFQYFNFECNWWLLFRKHIVRIKLDIYYVFINENVQARLNFLFYSTFQSRKKGCLVLNQVVSNLRWNWEKNVISVNGLINYMKYIVKNRGWRILMSMDCSWSIFYLVFQYFNFECNWWLFFRKHIVRIKLDIYYVFINGTWFNDVWMTCCVATLDFLLYISYKTIFKKK